MLRYMDGGSIWGVLKVAQDECDVLDMHCRFMGY